MSDSPSSFIGVDVSKAVCEVAVHGCDDRWKFPRDEEGLTRLREHLTALSPTLVVLEATGGMEVVAAVALALADIPVAVVSANARICVIPGRSEISPVRAASWRKRMTSTPASSRILPSPFALPLRHSRMLTPGGFGQCSSDGGRFLT